MTTEQVKKTHAYKTIMQIVENTRRVKERIEILSDRFHVENKAMGSGGVGQVKELKDHFRVQVSYGIGKWNYAYCVILYKS